MTVPLLDHTFEKSVNLKMSALSFVYQGVIVPASVAVPISIALFRYKHTNPAARTILLYLFVAGITNVVAAVYASLGINNLPLLHIYTGAELLLLLRFYRITINTPSSRKWIQLIAIFFPVTCIINFLFFQSIYTFNTYTRPLAAIIMIACSMTYLYRRTEKNTVGKWQHEPEMWMNAGLLLYFSSALFQFTFSNIVSHKAGFAIKMLIWNIHATLVLIMYMLFAVGFVIGRTKHATNNR